MSWSHIDEGPHAVGSSSLLWQESVVLAWRDPVSGIAGAHRIGHEPNWGDGGRCGLWSGVFTDDGMVFRTNVDGESVQTVGGYGFSTGAHRMVHDGTVLRYEAEEEGLSIALVIDDVPGTFVDLEHGHANYNSGDGKKDAEFFSHHMESHSRVRGTVRVGGRTFEVDAPAWRDHSWGIRHWDDIWGVRFFAGGDGTDANRYSFLSVVTANGEFRRMGTLRLDGRDLEISGASMLARVEDDGTTIPSAELVYRLADGSTRTLLYTAVGGQVGQTRHISWESVGDVALAGRPLGWAMLEGVNNHRGSRLPPAFVLDNAMTNGLRRTQMTG